MYGLRYPFIFMMVVKVLSNKDGGNPMGRLLI
jgi:hypothetical protein